MAIYAFASDAILQSFLLGESLNLKENEVPEGMKEFAEHIEANKDNKGCCWDQLISQIVPLNRQIIVKLI